MMDGQRSGTLRYNALWSCGARYGGGGGEGGRGGSQCSKSMFFNFPLDLSFAGKYRKFCECDRSGWLRPNKHNIVLYIMVITPIIIKRDQTRMYVCRMGERST